MPVKSNVKEEGSVWSQSVGFTVPHKHGGRTAEYIAASGRREMEDATQLAVSFLSILGPKPTFRVGLR